MKQYQITSRPRHLRYIFFIDESFSYDKLFELICLNQKLWGGRYNPIVPVSNNVISGQYIKLIENYDPDYVYYSSGVSPDIIKKLRLFNPAAYHCLDKALFRNDILGVDASYLLPLFDRHQKVLFTQGLFTVKSPLLDFYKVNFGLAHNTILHEYKIAEKHSKTMIGPDEFENLIGILHGEHPITKSFLSRSNVLATRLTAKRTTRYGELEMVVAKDKTSVADLIYFWNRFRYEMRNILYVTPEQLDLLVVDEYFGNLLYDLSEDDIIEVVSMSLNQAEVEKIIEEKFESISCNRAFRYKDISSFPFEILNYRHYENEYSESYKTQTLISSRGLFYLPKLSFTDKNASFDHKWVVDVELLEVADFDFRNKIKYPLTTDTYNIIHGVEGRINKSNNISIVIDKEHNSSDFLDITIPSFQRTLNQLICSPRVHGKNLITKHQYVLPHDSSNKLSAFIKAFNYNFNRIEDFFTDSFWVELFEYLITNEKDAGDSISFDEIKNNAIVVLQENDIELEANEEPSINEKNLEQGLKNILAELCDYGVFLKGFTLKCDNCSSKFWYSINEIKEKVVCKGCFDKFDLPIEPIFTYKLNDLIKNNIFQTKTERNGNLTVIRTLCSINRESRESFDYSSQINIFTDYYFNKPSNEIDVIYTSDGKLIIGEAKHNCKGFFEDKSKSLKSLVEISKIIHPDKIILSCYIDEHNKLKNVKKSLLRLFKDWNFIPDIETLLLKSPDTLMIEEGYGHFINTENAIW